MQRGCGRGRRREAEADQRALGALLGTSLGRQLAHTRMTVRMAVESERQLAQQHNVGAATAASPSTLGHDELQTQRQLPQVLLLPWQGQTAALLAVEHMLPPPRMWTLLQRHVPTRMCPLAAAVAVELLNHFHVAMAPTCSHGSLLALGNHADPTQLPRTDAPR